MKYFRKIWLALAMGASMALQAGPYLIWAATKGNVDALRAGVQSGEIVNDSDLNGWTPLMWAVYYDQLPATDWLLRNGADPNLQSTQGYKSFPAGSTALIIAGIQNLGDQAKTLLKHRANVDLKSQKGLSIMDYARKTGSRSVLQELGIKTTLDPKLDDLVAAIEAGKDVNQVDSNGWTPLMWAVFFRDLQTAKFFLEKGADPNIQATGSVKSHPVGSTALTIAGYLVLDEMAGTLVRNKARADLADAKGKRAEDFAHHHGFSSVVNAMADTTYLVNSYQNVVFAGPTLDAGIAKDLAYLAEECQLSARATLIRNGAFQTVENVTQGKSYDASTLLVKTEIIKTHSDGTYLAAKLSLVDAATGKVLREPSLASSNDFTRDFSISPFPRFSISDSPEHSPAEDLGATLASYILMVTGKVPAVPEAPGKKDSSSTRQLNFQADGFRLDQLRKQRTAIWPIVNASLDVDIAGTIYQEYGHRDKFLDVLSERLVYAVGGNSSSGILSPNAVRAIFSDRVSRSWLDPRNVLKEADRNPISGMTAQATDLGNWAQHPSLQGIRYAVIPRLFLIGREMTSSGSGASGFYVGGAGVGGRGARTSSSLQLVVVDLELKKKVWEGIFSASAGSTLMKATALHENEIELLEKLSKAMKVVK